MFSTFIEVNEIIKEELMIAMNNGRSDSYLGMDNLPRMHLQKHALLLPRQHFITPLMMSLTREVDIANVVVSED